jgi:hypothetical protein
MKYILLLFICFSPTDLFKYWENISEKEQIELLRSDDIDENALRFHGGKLKIGDNQQTKVLLDSLSNLSADLKIKALYFNLFNRICQKVDGSLSEILGTYCQDVIMFDPEYVLFYLKSHDSLRKKYVQFLGTEFYFKEEGTSEMQYDFCDFKKSINKRLCNDVRYKDFLISFYQEIQTVIVGME